MSGLELALGLAPRCVFFDSSCAQHALAELTTQGQPLRVPGGWLRETEHTALRVHHVVR